MNWTVIDNANQTEIKIIKGIIPWSNFPGKIESFDPGSPKKYLIGPDLVISHDTTNVANVDSNSTTGNDPEKSRRIRECRMS